MTVGIGFRRRRPWLALGLAAGACTLAAFLAVRALVERQALRRALPQLDGRMEVPGLEHEVVVVRDGRGIPHVRARSERDAWFGLGFVHAQDRLAQMTWLARSARGRTAAVIGRDGLEVDRWSRTLGFGRLADKRVERLPPETRRVLEAYAAGVNAWVARIHSGRARAPIPLQRLGIEPETWTPADSLAVEKLVAWGLDQSIDATLALGDLVDRLGGFAARPFFPPGAGAQLVPVPLPRLEARAGARDTTGALTRALGLAGRSVGSSAWLVAGRAAANGLPLLAGDLHLQPTAPSLLYEAHLTAPGFTVVGAGPPGVPVFWSGHNERVAWAATHARAAVVDLYLETLDSEDAGRYRAGSGWRRVEQHTERIEVRGGGVESWVVRTTHHGPLLDGLLADGRPPIAVAWAGARSGDGIGALVRAAHARDAAGFRAALADHDEPVFAFLFADTAGGGGRQVAGWLPRRAMATALVPVPGRSAWYDWRGRVPFAELPYAPLTDTWLIAADQPLGDDEPIEWWWRPGDRAERVEALLREATHEGPVDAAALAGLQDDVVSPAARKHVRLVLDLAGDPDTLLPEARQVARTLEAWDAGTGVDSRGAAAWHVLVRALLRRVLSDPFGSELLERYLELRGVYPEMLLDPVLSMALGDTSNPDALADAPRLRAAVRESLRQTGLSLRVELGPNPEKWLWGRLHALRFVPFGWTPGAWAGPLDETVWPYPGDGATVAVAEYDPKAPYDVRVVSAYRLVVDLASPRLALSALAPGESEHPADPRRRAGVERWLAGKPALLATHPFVVDEGAQARLVLTPERPP